MSALGVNVMLGSSCWSHHVGMIRMLGSSCCGYVGLGSWDCAMIWDLCGMIWDFFGKWNELGLIIWECGLFGNVDYLGMWIGNVECFGIYWDLWNGVVNVE